MKDEMDNKCYTKFIFKNIHGTSTAMFKKIILDCMHFSKTHPEQSAHVDWQLLTSVRATSSIGARARVP